MGGNGTSWFIILQLIIQTCQVLLDIMQALLGAVRDRLNVEINLHPENDFEVNLGGPILTTECTDNDVETPYFQQLLWQERGDRLREIHARMEVSQMSPPPQSNTESVAQTSVKEPLCASVDQGTQTEEQGTVPEMPTEMVDSGDGEVHDQQTVSQARPRGADSGYGTNGSVNQQESIENAKPGTCDNEGLSPPPDRFRHSSSSEEENEGYG